jgi:hypothetical protein
MSRFLQGARTTARVSRGERGRVEPRELGLFDLAAVVTGRRRSPVRGLARRHVVCPRRVAGGLAVRTLERSCPSTSSLQVLSTTSPTAASDRGFMAARHIRAERLGSHAGFCRLDRLSPQFAPTARHDSTSLVSPADPPALASSWVGTRWEQIASSRGLSWPLVSSREIALCRQFGVGRGDRVQVEAPPTEPKVRGSNPLGRAWHPPETAGFLCPRSSPPRLRARRSAGMAPRWRP